MELLNRKIPWYARLLGLTALITCVFVGGYAFLAEVATIPSRTGHSATVYGNQARWASLFFVCFGLMLSFYVFSPRIAKMAMYLAGILFLVSVMGPYFTR